jgi:hypothetical protein
VRLLRPRAISSAARYRRDGYIRRALDNQRQRILYTMRLVAPRAARLHDGSKQ